MICGLCEREFVQSPAQERQNGRRCPRCRTLKWRATCQQRHRERNRLKHRARAMTAYHIKQGHLVRGRCETCGADETEAHHDDYTLPLSVRWLCKTCHEAFHAEKRVA